VYKGKATVIVETKEQQGKINDAKLPNNV